MGAQLLLLQLSFTTAATTSPPPSLPSLLNPNKSSTNSRSGVGPHLAWKKNNTGPTSSGPFSFNLEEDELYTHGFDRDDDGYDEFGFNGAAKQRVWWFNDNGDDDDDDDIWDVDYEENEFWVFKVIRSFGWMLPAIAISLLLGTGPNAFFMALAVPLGQTALSLVMDKVWGSPSGSPKPGPSTKNRKKPFVRATSRTKTRERKEENKTGEGRGSYQSWVATDDGSCKKSAKTEPSFGGWDELDRESHNIPTRTPGQKADGLPKQQNRSKLSRRGRVRDTPLLLRLMIAVFPFLASWTKFLF